MSVRWPARTGNRRFDYWGAPAAEFGVLPNRIGIIGYSAGGALSLSTVYGPAEGRPDLAFPIYAAGASSNPPPQGAPLLFIAIAADDQPADTRARLIWSVQAPARDSTTFRPKPDQDSRLEAALLLVQQGVGQNDGGIPLIGRPCG